MLEEKIKIAAETAVEGSAKPSGIFPQPEAGLVDRQTQVCFSSPFQWAQSLRIIISHNFYYYYYKTVFQSAIFFSYCYYSFIYLTKCFSWLSVCRS